MKSVRCAIYTRKSSDEGLEQGFNSLDAQREACAAYILSQASEGWTLVPDLYDDGGWSGGTLERPALKALLADVQDGRIDIIVVYKVDRLTRSLLDFSKLVEAFDQGGVSFVSITQSFNTTTSMGRLTLNMLLSFAQFEREVTAERIRDKIAASKAKGMWMGGTPPLGYRPDGRSLAIVDSEAELIRHIYNRYLALGAVRLLADELDRHRVVTPNRERISGASFGGRPFSRGQLYAILKNPIYTGRIAHNGTLHEGLHEAIIDADIWARVQARLAEHVQGNTGRARTPRDDLLAGLVFDQAGDPLVATHASKGRVRYRYYVSRSLQLATGHEGLRVPAPELERAVTHQLCETLSDGIALAARAGLVMAAASIARHDARCEQLAGKVKARDRETIRALIDRVTLTGDGLEIALRRSALAAALVVELDDDSDAPFVVRSAAAIRRTGRAVRLVQGDTDTTGSDPALAKLLARAHGWWAILKRGETDITRLAEQEGITASWLTRVLRLAFLSPEITQAICAGRAPASLTVLRLVGPGAVPMDWQEQALAYGRGEE